MPFDLITDAEVAAELAVSVDARITRIVKAAHAYIYRVAGWDFERRERTTYCRGYGGGVDFLFLDAAPIWSVAEVRIDASGSLDASTAVSDLTSFAFDSTALDFRLHYLGGYFPEATRAALVRFTAGYHPTSNTAAPESEPRVPNDLREEAILECARRWKRGFQEQHLSESKSLGDFSFSFTRREAAQSSFVQAVRAYRRSV